MEQQQLKKCPIGIQTFEKIIEGNYLYVDKTEYVYRMVHGASNYCFLSRPRFARLMSKCSTGYSVHSVSSFSMANPLKRSFFPAK